MLESVTYIKRDDVIHTKLNDNLTSLGKAGLFVQHSSDTRQLKDIKIH